jgi:CheY-like chemotaxis protein
MDGSVWAESSGEGKGAIFHVKLPLILAQTASHVQSSSGEHQALLGDIVRRLTNKHLLLVDDDPATLESLGALLESFGLKVRTVANVSEAIHAIFQEQPDLLVSDIAMPGEDGYSLIRKVRALTQKKIIKPLPALALTAYADKDTFEEAQRAGYDAFLSKPVDPSSLLGLIDSTLSNFRRFTQKAA